jgi:hypothetical protein
MLCILYSVSIIKVYLTINLCCCILQIVLAYPIRLSIFTNEFADRSCRMVCDGINEYQMLEAFNIQFVII